MVNGALGIGGFLGVLISGAFIYWEIGRYAAPQVPTSLFDERKEVFAYTAGLFVGVPIAFAFLLMESAIANGAVIAAIIDILVLVGAVELAQWLLARSVYFGRSGSMPFYALGFRAGLGGILVVAAVTAYFGSADTLDAVGIAATLGLGAALLAVQVTGGLQSVRRTSGPGSPSGGPIAGAMLSLAAFVVLGLGVSLGGPGELAAALLIIAGIVPAYRRLRRGILDALARGEEAPPKGEGVGPSDRPFGRTPR
jgi:hypothetical protein